MNLNMREVYTRKRMMVSPHIDEVVDRIIPVLTLVCGTAKVWTRDDVKRELINLVELVEYARADPEKWGEFKPNQVVRFGALAVHVGPGNAEENYEVFVSVADIFGMQQVRFKK